ncbi:MAG: PIN domain-containing protein [archaeon]
MTEIEPIFVDTNILVYAHQKVHDRRNDTARQILKECFEGKTLLTISNQILGEFCRVVRHKMDRPLPDWEIIIILQDILATPSFKIVNYSSQTVVSAMKEGCDVFIWDAIIAQTMRENGITTIYTENTKDFQKIKGIKPINPFAE